MIIHVYLIETIILFVIPMLKWFWKSKDDDPTQDDLKKQGFNPQATKTSDSKDEPIMDFSKDYEGFLTASPEQILEILNSYEYFSNESQHRHPLAYSNGGRLCEDSKQVDKIRSIGKEMIKIIGKKIISGDFNLTKIPFPIKAMVPKSALESVTLATCTFPLFAMKAAETKDAGERFRLIIAAIFSAFYYMNLFLKPLNPIIGETLVGSYPDGTEVYCQQISHHPPVTYILVVGPNNKYRYYGYSHYEAKAGLNSMTLINSGKRTFEFQDNEKVEVTFPKETFSGVFLGTLRSETVGHIEFKDKKNKLETSIQFGKVKKKPSDYFEGVIVENGKKGCKVEGSYMGYLNIDSKRYFDGSKMKPYRIQIEQSPLHSDHRLRKDLNALKDNNIPLAQKQKDHLEEIQRTDDHKRKKFKKQKHQKH